MKDPRRTFNQDETPLSPGVEYQRVLTEKGWDCPVYNQGGDARLHIDEQMVIIFEIASNFDIVHTALFNPENCKTSKYLSQLCIRWSKTWLLFV